MPWRNGGVIGKRNLPSAGVSSGVWQLGEIEAARRDAAWPSGNDLFYSSVTTLLHLNTSFADTSGTPKTFTAVGNAQINQTQAQFGSGSMALDGNGGRLDSTSNAAFAMSTGDFVVELFVRFAALTTVQTGFVNVQVSGGFSFYYNGSSGTFFGVPVNTLVVSNRSSNSTTAAWSPALNVWYHLAVSRASGNLRVFVDGTQINTTVTAHMTNYAQGGIQIGGWSDSATGTLNGFIDEVRITKGNARGYTANFVAPTSPFQDS